MKAIIQCADTGPLESLVVMLRSVGIECLLPNEKLRGELRSIGCDTVLEIKGLVENWGYDWPFPEAPLPYAELEDMARADVIFVDVKGHRNGPIVTRRWPNLAGRILWYRINGGKPEHVVRRCQQCLSANPRPLNPCHRCIDHGDEVNPGCPVLTPNQWYDDRDNLYSDAVCSRCNGSGDESPAELCQNCDHCWGWCREPYPWRDFVSDQQKAYTCWPPFVRFADYRADRSATFTQPICLIHGIAGWGYGALLDSFRGRFGLQVFGRSSPDGLIQHQECINRLQSALAMVHLKSSDAPGYALYEALAAACPVVCTRRLIWRCRMQELLIPGETCLVFDRETHEGLTPEDVASCTAEVAGHLERLRDPAENRRIGGAGRKRLKEIMWDASRDDGTLREFMRRNFG